MADSPSTASRRTSGIEALLENFMRLGRDGMSVLLAPWLAIAVVDLGFVIGAGAVVVAANTADPGTAAGMTIQIIAGIQLLVVMGLRVALLNAVREVGLQGRGAMESLGAVLRDVLGRFVPSLGVMVVVGVVVGVGLFLCVIPGLVALFFLAFAPYLVAARRVPILESLAESVRWARKEWALLLSALVVAVIAAGFIGCAMGVAAGIAPRMTTGVITGLAGGWVLNTVLGYIAFLWWGAVYVTAESRQQVEYFEKTAPDTAPRPDQPGEGLRRRSRTVRQYPSPDEQGREGPEPEQASPEAEQDHEYPPSEQRPDDDRSGGDWEGPGGESTDSEDERPGSDHDDS